MQSGLKFWNSLVWLRLCKCYVMLRLRATTAGSYPRNKSFWDNLVPTERSLPQLTINIVFSVFSGTLWNVALNSCTFKLKSIVHCGRIPSIKWLLYCECEWHRKREPPVIWASVCVGLCTCSDCCFIDKNFGLFLSGGGVGPSWDASPPAGGEHQQGSHWLAHQELLFLLQSLHTPIAWFQPNRYTLAVPLLAGLSIHMASSKNTKWSSYWSSLFLLPPPRPWQVIFIQMSPFFLHVIKYPSFMFEEYCVSWFGTPGKFTRFCVPLQLGLNPIP